MNNGAGGGSRPAVLFHIRASQHYGWGHLVRAGRLAGVIGADADCRFVVEGEADAQAYLQESGCTLIARFGDPVPSGASDYSSALQGWRPSVVVFDMLMPNRAAIAGYKQLGAKVLVVSDEGHSCDVADITLCPNPRELWATPTPEALVGGLEYIITPPNLALLREKTAPESGQYLLVNTGGATTQRTYDKMLEVLCLLSDAGLRGKYALGYSGGVRLGDAPKLAPNFEIVANVQDMADLVEGATAAFATAGYIRYELAYLGLPMILTSIVDHQDVFGRWCASAGIADYAGPLYHTPAMEIADRVIDFIENASRQHAQRQKAMTLVDGQGARRFADLVLSVALRQVDR